MAYLYRKDPKRVTEVGTVHLDLEPDLRAELEPASAGA
jgi:hypothetical protein